MYPGIDMTSLAALHTVGMVLATMSLKARAYALMALIVAILWIAGLVLFLGSRVHKTKNNKGMADGGDSVHDQNWHEELRAHRPERAWGEE